MAQYRNQLRRKSNKLHIFNFKLLFHITDTYFITKFHFIKLLIFTLYFLQNESTTIADYLYSDYT